MDPSVLARGLPAEVVLGERGALVWQLVLGSDQDQLAVEALLAQHLRRLRAGEPAADDHMSVASH
jgi:hypothetical protein